MKKYRKYVCYVLSYALVLTLFLLSGLGGSRAITVLSENAPISVKRCVVIDPGHGGVDGGATSCTGKLESAFNLEISLRLNDLMHLLGIQTKMIRTADCSVYTEGNTIAAKKVSDLKQRVRMIEGSSDPLLISIHQNYYGDGRYSGAQVFYAPTEGSRELADCLQNAFIKTVNPTSHRNIKKADGIYLMQHISCPGVLIECGFLSNHQEEAKLRDGEYQKKLCAVIASQTAAYLSRT